MTPIPSARPPSARRDSPEPSPRELKQAVKLLFAAAGIQHLSIERPHKGGGSSGGGSSSSSKAPEFLTASAVKLVLRNDTRPHLGALQELVYVYREGEGQAESVLSCGSMPAASVKCRCVCCRQLEAHCLMPEASAVGGGGCVKVTDARAPVKQCSGCCRPPCPQAMACPSIQPSRTGCCSC